MTSGGSRGSQYRDMDWTEKHAVKMVTHQSEANDECRSRQSLDKVLTVDKVCMASGDDRKNWKCFSAKLFVGGDHLLSFQIDNGGTCNLLRQQDMLQRTELNKMALYLPFTTGHGRKLWDHVNLS